MTDQLAVFERTLCKRELAVFRPAFEKARETLSVEEALEVGRRAVNDFRVTLTAPRRWKKHRSLPQIDLWRGEEHLAVVWLEGGVKVGREWQGGTWKWALLVSGHKDQTGPASSPTGAKAIVLCLLNDLSV